MRECGKKLKRKVNKGEWKAKRNEIIAINNYILKYLYFLVVLLHSNVDFSLLKNKKKPITIQEMHSKHWIYD